MENVRDKKTMKFSLKQQDAQESEKQGKCQSKLNFDGVKSCRSFEVHRFERKKLLLDKPYCIELTKLELTRLFMYAAYFDILQPFVRLEASQLLFIVCDSLLLSINN